MEDIILYKKSVHSLNTNNGILNEANLKFAKQTLLFDTVRELTDLVETKQGYPQNDISDVNMEIDCVIMSRKRYNKLINFENKGLFVSNKEQLN
jgi:hypothetical protein